MECDGHHMYVWAEVAMSDKPRVFILLQRSFYRGEKGSDILEQSDWIADSNNPLVDHSRKILLWN